MQHLETTFRISITNCAKSIEQESGAWHEYLGSGEEGSSGTLVEIEMAVRIRTRKAEYRVNAY